MTLTDRTDFAERRKASFDFRGIVACLLGYLFLNLGTLCAVEPNQAGIDFFESQVRPILVEHCYRCHSLEAGESSGELRLDSRSAMLAGGTRGKVYDAAAPEQSLLLKAVEYRDAELQMPPMGKIPEPQIAILRKWIEMGAPDPRQDTVAAAVGNSMEGRIAQAASHWAYQPLQPPAAPANPSASGHDPWVRDPLDQHVVRELASRGLAPSEEADRRTLIRRLYFDLLGLPPTIEDFAKWVNYDHQDWYQQLVNSLLDSPHFGERMARRWMDVARYADNKGYVFQEDREYPHAYRYRDWLIRAFNSDLGYNDFIRYQLIADQLDPQNANGHLDAMGMLTLGRRFLQNKNDIIDDRIDVLCRGLLGVTASCARCHDHKFDPVTTADYYSLHGMFSDCDEPGNDPSPLRLVDKENQSKTYVFLRGNSANKGPRIDRDFFGHFAHESRRAMIHGSGRLDVAEGIVAQNNPLTARVYVNRLWGWITGAPLVDTPSDFGLRCDRPIYQPILDDLAWDLVHNGWSTKKVIARIVSSSTYRQCSHSNPKATEMDPENRLLWRANRKRLDFESYRDAMLKVSGTLDPKIGGKSEVIHASPFSRRRTVYAYIDRQNLPPIFRSFDFASPDAHVPQRAQTTVPQQGLVLMNSEFMLDLLRPFVLDVAAKSFKTTSVISDEQTLGKQVDVLFERLLARSPAKEERKQFVDFLKRCDVTLVDSPLNCWTYGYGHLEVESKRLLSFQRFPLYKNGSWSGNDGVPDKELGYALLRDKGGHPGKSSALASVRRWTAPRPGELSINGTLEHPSELGDGVRATVLQNRSQSHACFTIKKEKTATSIASIHVDQGDSIDFVVDCLDNENHDDFSWSVAIKYKDANERFDSKEHFSGMQPVPASPLQQAAQAILITNEFCFVD
jgi:hypothetical protein